MHNLRSPWWWPGFFALHIAAASAADTVAGGTAAIAVGRAAFEARGCTACHGAQGEGGVRLAGNTLDREAIIETISEGRMRGGLRMPPWGGVISEEEIGQLADYVLSLGAGSGAVIGPGMSRPDGQGSEGSVLRVSQ